MSPGCSHRDRGRGARKPTSSDSPHVRALGIPPLRNKAEPQGLLRRQRCSIRLRTAQHTRRDTIKNRKS